MMLSAAEPRRKNLTALYIDGEFAVSVDTETFLKSGFRAGSELDDDALRGLIRASDTRRAEEKALYLLGYSARSKKELADRIARTAPREAAEKAAQHMEDLGLVNDEEYARAYARELFGRKGYAASRVIRELQRRGIGRELAERAAEEFAVDPVEKIREIVDRRYSAALGDEKGRRRCIAALQRLGYRWDDIRTALRELTTDEDGSE